MMNKYCISVLGFFAAVTVLFMHLGSNEFVLQQPRPKTESKSHVKESIAQSIPLAIEDLLISTQLSTELSKKLLNQGVHLIQQDPEFDKAGLQDLQKYREKIEKIRQVNKMYSQDMRKLLQDLHVPYCSIKK